MSGTHTILAMLATFALMMLGLIPLFRMAHNRMDEIVSGVVDGLPVSTKYRFVMLFYDFVGYVALGVVLMTVFAAGFRQASNMEGAAGLGSLADLCSYACIFLAAAIVVLTGYLFFYMLSLIREADKHSP